MGTAEISRETTETLGAPALEAAGLRLWIHGRQFPSAHDLDEGNLLWATILCESDGLIVRSEGAGIRASDVARWARDLRELLKGTTALARLSVKKRVLEIAFHQTEDLERVLARYPGVERVITSARTPASLTSASHEYQSSPSVVVDARKYGTTAATAVNVSSTVTTDSLARPVASRVHPQQ